MQDTKLILAISSRALFDLDASDRVYEQQGLEAYRRYQIDHEEETLTPGPGFDFVKKLLNINKLLNKPRVEVILLSRNSADTGLRIFNSIKAHDLEITRAAFCGGDSPYKYIQAFACDLFLSTDAEDVGHALVHGVAAATLLPRSHRPAAALNKEPSAALNKEPSAALNKEPSAALNKEPSAALNKEPSAALNKEPSAPQVAHELRMAFDGDSVLFSDEAEQIYQREGLDAFASAEASKAGSPLEGGPFKGFLRALHALQQEFTEAECPIRTALVTARSAPAHERVIRTLRAWDIRLDESLFLGGLDKTAFLSAFGADVFFDDQSQNCERASDVVTSGHVPHGVVNQSE